MRIVFAVLILAVGAGVLLWGLGEFMRLPDFAFFIVAAAIVLALLAVLINKRGAR